MGGSAHGSAWWTLFAVGCLLVAGIAVITRRRLAQRGP
jgi:hypothetical protein